MRGGAVVYTTYPGGAVSCSACIRAIELIRIADQMLKDGMEYAQVRVIFDENRDDCDGIVKISAIPNATSDDVTIYPEIRGRLMIEIEDEDID